MKILVTGGAGYIGSITVKELILQGHEIVVFDNLIHGNKENVSCKLVVGDLLDKEFLNKSLADEKFDAVMHFAAHALAGESMQEPFKYFQNNILGGLNLLELMRVKNIQYIIFSSTCAIYGIPQSLPVTENETMKPESVYGESKLSFERILPWYDKIYNIKYINLRYFNAAGGALDGSLGENHNPETHIIPLAIQTALKQREQFDLHGTDYSTEDGTCVRDYIHVEDLAQAHILALKKLEKTGISDSFNLGTGRGYSNLEVLAMVKKISGVDFLIKKESRRSGDPAIIFADNKKAEKELGFTAKYSDLETIVKTAFEWNKRLKMKNEK